MTLSCYRFIQQKFIRSCNLLLADSQKLNTVVAACKEAGKGSDISIQSSKCDVTDRVQVQDAVMAADEVASKAAPSTSSVASILVNCAGITRDARVQNMSDEDWNAVLDVNLKGSFLMCQAFCAPERVSSLVLGNTAAGGSIINIGSIVSKYGNIGQVNYAASKGGVIGLTRSLAKEMASLTLKTAKAFGPEMNTASDEEDVLRSIRVNCIQPGFIHTPMAHAVPEKILSDMKRKIALRRFGRAEDVANLALFLASSERCGYITGESFECSGMLRL
ncbi:hypothetical protein ACHAWF_015644 [Thalassiosira exigua]